jgi:hypothetical protein
VLTLAAAGALRAQPAFPTGVERVAVDVAVVDREGRPVADLRAEDFVVKVGGRARKVATAQLVRHVAAAPEGGEPAPSPATSSRSGR